MKVTHYDRHKGGAGRGGEIARARKEKAKQQEENTQERARPRRRTTRPADSPGSAGVTVD